MGTMLGQTQEEERHANFRQYRWGEMLTEEGDSGPRATVDVDLIFTGETCADAWIEKEVVALKEDGCPKVWVVTSDSCQQKAAHGAVVPTLISLTATAAATAAAVPNTTVVVSAAAGVTPLAASLLRC
ncbi:hypothetical protein EJ110_NYTH56917 [Nymphaea thermarum]|nr:hypothetical protein EJ110_NYTH56917 [Nymphaea thermarum]